MDMQEFDEARRQRMSELSEASAERAVLEERHGQVWDTEQLRADFEVRGFLAPFVVVRRRSDGQLGSLEFQASPRFYFNFKVDQRPQE